MEYEGVDVWIHIFLISALASRAWSASCPGRFNTGERTPATHWIGGWVDPRAGLNDVEKRKFLTLPGLELRSLGRPARSQSLYWLGYLGSYRADNALLESRYFDGIHFLDTLYIFEQNVNYRINRSSLFSWINYITSLEDGLLWSKHVGVLTKCNKYKEINHLYI
jgi:hypothetical protein